MKFSAFPLYEPEELVMKENYVLAWHDSEKNTGGVKAKSDTVYFLAQKGFKVIETPKSKIKKEIASIFAKQKLSRLNGNLLIQYPSGNDTIRKLWMRAAVQNPNLKVLVLVHDLEVLRFHNDERHMAERKQEIQFLNQADGLIVLNSKMQELLITEGITIPMVPLKIWDYDNPQPFNEEFKYDKTICYAGNLIKSEFLSKVNAQHKLHVFGPNSDLPFTESIVYEGEYSPQELPRHLNYNFGLIWDGISIRTCTGSYGQYLRFNNPHKTSLYLSTGLPVIVWKDAAIANFINENKVGKVISNLEELDQLLDSISEKEFVQMKKNAIKIGKRMRKGIYISEAFSELIRQLNSI